MSLLDYESRFAKLNMNRSGGNVSPHKVAMMLAVLDLIESDEISVNRIDYSPRLTDAFSKWFDVLKGPQDRNNPHLPYFHLRTEGFWHHHLNPGKSEAYGHLTTVSGAGQLIEIIAYAYLDDELFELLKNHGVREWLRRVLHLNLDISNENRQSSFGEGGWDWLEGEACVADYFSMLHKELRGEPYSKAAHRRLLISKLNNRSEGSVEFKHQNISAVLIQMGFPYISGYKPRFNYQAQLKDVILAYLAAHQADIDTLSVTQEVAVPPYIANWEKVLDDNIPELIPAVVVSDRKFIARKLNYTQVETNNRRLGASGEQFVVEYERFRLQQAGREDLAREVAWSSDTEGDGLGYDVSSFAIEKGVATDKPHYIEVKTTNSGKYQPFFITANELEFSKAFSGSYSLYRVYDFNDNARLFRMEGAVNQFVNLRAELFRASFTGANTNRSDVNAAG